jgi:hypothetical protein
MAKQESDDNYITRNFLIVALLIVLDKGQREGPRLKKGLGNRNGHALLENLVGITALKTQT